MFKTLHSFREKYMFLSSWVKKSKNRNSKNLKMNKNESAIYQDRDKYTLSNAYARERSLKILR